MFSCRYGHRGQTGQKQPPPTNLVRQISLFCPKETEPLGVPIRGILPARKFSVKKLPILITYSQMLSIQYVDPPFDICSILFPHDAPLADRGSQKGSTLLFLMMIKDMFQCFNRPFQPTDSTRFQISLSFSLRSL